MGGCITFFLQLFLVFILSSSSYIFGSNSSYYDKVAALNFNKRYFLGRIEKDFQASQNNGTFNNEMIRQCTCQEYDKCVDITFESIRISQCENYCLKILNAPGLNFDKYLSTLKKRNAYAYVIHNCFSSNDRSYCSLNSTTFFPKKNNFFNFEAKLRPFLLKNDILINNSIELRYENWQVHECSGECLLEHVKHCFKYMECDIALPYYGVHGCIISDIPKIEHGYNLPPSFIKGRIHSLENVSLIPDKHFYDMVANYSKKEKERLAKKSFF